MKRKNLILKIFSLGVGIAISFVLIAKVCFESSYDSFYKDIDRIYKIKAYYTYQEESGYSENISGAIAPGIKQYAPGVEAATRTTGLFDSDYYFLEDQSRIGGKLLVADTSFFQVFDREILAGDAFKVLNTRGQLMISRSFAEKMGGIEQAIGQQIANEGLPHIKFTVGGVFEDFPKNGTIHSDLLLSMETYTKQSTENWVGNDRYYGYVKLQKGVNPESLYDAMRLMQEEHQQEMLKVAKAGDDMWYRLMPLSQLHTSYPEVHNTILILSIVSIILLVISLMNYTLIAISEIVKRSKEMGVHKCYGAEASDIYKMLIKETAVTILSSLAFAALIVYAAKPIIEELMGVQLIALFIPQTAITLALVLCVVFCISTFVPAYLYQRVPISIVFRNYQVNKRRWKLGLLSMEFVINIFLAGFLFVIAAQYQNALHADVGYHYKNVLFYRTQGVDSVQVQRAIEQLRSLPEVVAVERCYSLPTSYSSGNNIFLPGKETELFNVADQYLATPGFFDLFEIPIVEGRVPIAPNEVAVSRSFLTKMKEFADWSDGPIGKEIGITEHGNVVICGVYEDYTIHSATDPDKRPSVRFTASEPVSKMMDDYLGYTLVKLHTVDPEAVEKVRQVVKESIEGRDVAIFSYAEEMKHLYQDSKQMRNTILAGCFFAIAIAFLGLIGYLRDEALRRSKEIAVRKINGATSSEIIRLFVKDILKLALIAVVIGDALGYYVASSWLEHFAMQINWPLAYFFLADVIVVALIVAIVVINSLTISRANPVDSLKNE